MPDVLLAARDVSISGRWAGKAVNFAATVTVHAEGLFLDQAEIPWRSLSDATLARDELVLHRTPESLVLRGPVELPAMWALVVEHACPVPEVTSGLRFLKPPPGKLAEWQPKILGPLLSARRRIQPPDAPERRVMQLNASEISERLQRSLSECALDRYPEDPPHRRALEAHLEEAAEGLFQRLQELDASAEALLGAADGSRFLAWRGWTHRLRRVFVEADRAWHLMAPHLMSG